MAGSYLKLCKGVVYWTMLGFAATLGVLFMLMPVLPLIYISPYYFRKIADYFITFYLMFVTVSEMMLVKTKCCPQPTVTQSAKSLKPKHF